MKTILDKDFIEELGFERTGPGWYSTGTLDISQLGHWTDISLRSWHNNSLYIKAYRGAISEDNEDSQMLFDGFIENKQELEQLLKLLHIKMDIRKNSPNITRHILPNGAIVDVVDSPLDKPNKDYELKKT